MKDFPRTLAGKQLLILMSCQLGLCNLQYARAAPPVVVPIAACARALPLAALASYSLPTGTIRTYLAYDGNGNLTSRTDGNGQTTNFAYDDMNRLAQIDDPGGASRTSRSRTT